MSTSNCNQISLKNGKVYFLEDQLKIEDQTKWTRIFLVFISITNTIIGTGNILNHFESENYLMLYSGMIILILTFITIILLVRTTGKFMFLWSDIKKVKIKKMLSDDVILILKTTQGKRRTLITNSNYEDLNNMINLFKSKNIEVDNRLKP